MANLPRIERGRHVHDFSNDHSISDQEETIQDHRQVELVLDTKDHSAGLGRSIN